MTRTLMAVGTGVLAVLTVAPRPAPADRLETRQIPPGVVVMVLPGGSEAVERPAVEFDHTAHTSALEQEGCRACHLIDEGGLVPQLAGTVDVTDRDLLIDIYHDACMSCHATRSEAALASGPITCGECHARRPPAVSIHAELRFDYSLHGRHALAYPETCDPCHHVYDEARQELAYEKGAEAACHACHGDRDEGETPSLRNAAHNDCVGCHLQRIGGKLESGPVLCVGCHDVEQQRAIEVLEDVPRLLRGQPDTLWVHTEGTTGKLVPFEHLDHEQNTSACSDCHHATLDACGDCHGLTGAAEGGDVVLERAHHMATSGYSCVGCHASSARVTECLGCHHTLTQPPGEAACLGCHSGPIAAQFEDAPAQPVVVNHQLEPLPATSDDFPETVMIDVMVDKYEAAKLPHRKMVERLDRGVRESDLAVHFHGDVDRLCAGCHHHTPVGVRPPSCRSCHGASAHATLDKPDLYTAYHRQCIGCHQRMQLEEQGCEDCHAEREGQT